MKFSKILVIFALLSVSAFASEVQSETDVQSAVKAMISKSEIRSMLRAEVSDQVREALEEQGIFDWNKIKQPF